MLWIRAHDGDLVDLEQSRGRITAAECHDPFDWMAYTHIRVGNNAFERVILHRGSEEEVKGFMRRLEDYLIREGVCIVRAALAIET